MNSGLYFGDCLKLLPLLPEGCIDMVLGDLPYGSTKCRWDVPIDLALLWIQLRRVCKHTTPILLFAQTPFDKVLGASNLPMLKYEWIWEKTQATGHLNSKKMPMKAHENILVFYNRLPLYIPYKTEGHSPVNSHRKPIDVQNRTTVYGRATKELIGGGNTDRFPRSVLKFPSDKQTMKHTDFIHATQKPVALCKYFIETYTNAGAIVLDMTCGSGTTGVACIETGRKYILMENDIVEYRKTKRRLAQYL